MELMSIWAVPQDFWPKAFSRRFAGPPPANRCFADIAGRSVAHSHLHPVDLHLDCVLLRPDAGIGCAAFLSERPFWLFAGGDRTVDYAVANRNRLRGAGCGAFGRALSRWPSGWHRTSTVRGRTRRARVSARASDDA